MGDWIKSVSKHLGGRFQIIAHKPTAGGRTVDITSLRGAMTQLSSYSNADPFGDASCQLGFPALTPFDDPYAPDLITWFGQFTNIDIYWVPAIAAATQYITTDQLVIDPLTNRPDILTPTYLRNAAGVKLGDQRKKVWEGWIASLESDSSETDGTLQIQCKGALYQADHYYAYPWYPKQPWPLELLIAEVFAKKGRRQNLRTGKFQIAWPSGWTRRVPKYDGATTAYTLFGTPGSKYTGYASRQTGAWDHALTGFVQDQLTLMLTDEKSGVKAGDQWTIQQLRRAAGVSPGRQPVLQVRSSSRSADFAMWLGTPGLSHRLTSDGTQISDVIYGAGTGIDGTGWRNAVISRDGSRTDYAPLAAGRNVYPYPTGASKNPSFDQGAFVTEGYTNFGSGFDMDDAINVAAQQLARNSQPGWQGSITLSSDPSSTLPRWLIRAGMTMVLRGFAGTGATGMRFHISAVTANPMDGTVELTVDTRYRDLLTLDEALSRSRDPLTPVKMLQVNRASVMIDDIAAPWDYASGSGFIPRDSRAFHKLVPSKLGFPYVASGSLKDAQKKPGTQKYPPSTYGDWYVKVAAASRDSRNRWSGPIKVLASEKDSIARTEFCAYDFYGRRIKVPYHVSFYYVNTPVTAMPHLHGSFSPFQNNAFERVDPVTGANVSPALWPDPSFIVGWGGKSGGLLNRAGFWPGRESDKAPLTGQFVDEGTWSFDCSANGPGAQYFAGANPPKAKAPESAITIYCMIYAEYTEAVYFMGRLYRQNPGVN